MLEGEKESSSFVDQTGTQENKLVHVHAIVHFRLGADELGQDAC